MRLPFMFLGLGLLLPVCAAAQQTGAGGPAWQEWSDGAFRQAARENRLVLLDLSAEWCAFCKKMDLTTYRDPRVLELIDSAYVPVRIEDEKHPELAETYREYGRPATVILDPGGNELLRKRGYLKPQWMIWMLEAVRQQGAG